MATITQIKDEINRLNAASFQILCDEYLSHIGYNFLVSLGTEAGRQQTTKGTPDTYYITSDGKYVFAEYTTTKTGLAAKIQDDINKCLDTEKTGISLDLISEIVYCHTSSNITPETDLMLHRICESSGIKLTLIGIDALAQGLMHYPAIVKDHLQLSIDSGQIQSIDDFAKQYNSNPLSAPLDTVFLSRENIIAELDSAFEKVDVVLLKGCAGVGKTRLALEYARSHSSDNNEKALCIHSNSRELYEDLFAYIEKPGKYFIVIDDANQLSEIRYVVEYVNKHQDGFYVKILCTVRDYALEKVCQDISNITNYTEVQLDKFSDDNIQQLVKNQYSIYNSFYLDRICKISEGNARIAMLAGRIASETNRLDSIKDATTLYDNYYGSALRSAEIYLDDSMLVTLGIVSFLHKFDLKNTDYIIPVLEGTGVSRKDFEKKLYTLHEHEIIDIYKDRAVVFSDQCLENFVLKYVFFDRKTIKLSSIIEIFFSSRRGQIFYSIDTLLSVFYNEELKSYVESEIRIVWDKHVKSKGSGYFEYVKAFFQVFPTDSLLIIKDLIDKTEPVYIPVEKIDTEKDKNNEYVNDDIISILCSFTYTDCHDAALDLFFEYYIKRPDLYIQFYHASTVYYGIKRISLIQQCQLQIKFLEKIIEHSDNLSNPYVLLLFVDIAKAFLAFEFTYCEDSRSETAVNFCRLSISKEEGVLEYRKIIWETLYRIHSSGNFNTRIAKILQEYWCPSNDRSYEVVRYDADFICKIVSDYYSPDSLSHCLLVAHLKKVFDRVGYKNEVLDLFINSPKLEKYYILSGPDIKKFASFESRRNARKQLIESYLMSSSDMLDSFNSLFDMYIEIAENNSRECYALAQGINSAISVISKNNDVFLPAAFRILFTEDISNLDTYLVIRALFTMMLPADVMSLVSQSHLKNRNIWMFTYFCELPEKYVNIKEVNNLYAFLKDDSDKELTVFPQRGIEFLEKFQSVDKNIILSASKIILEKQIYSPSIVSSYFYQLFFEPNQSADLLRKYEKDISILEKIYLFTESFRGNYDLEGEYLYQICNTDPKFIANYTELIISGKCKSIQDGDSKLCVFYNSQDYITIYDSIATIGIEKASYPYWHVPKLLKCFLIFSDKWSAFTEKRDCWIKHYIVENNKDSVKMECLFEALAEISLDWMKDYIELFCKSNNDAEAFCQLPLIPRSFSWSGSAVPILHSHISYYESLLPLFNGIKYLKHKKHIEELIDERRRFIEREEISDILER